MATSVETALAAARERAAQNTAAGLPASGPAEAPMGTYNAPAVTSARPPSLMESTSQSGVVVDEWLKVTGDGIKIGNGKIAETLDVEIDFADVTVVYSARGEIAGQVAYVKSRDGVTSVDGRHWGQALRDLQAGNPAKFTGQFTTYEIPMTLVKDYSKDVPAGTTVGYQPAVIGAKEFVRFLKKAPENLQNLGPVAVKLTHVPKSKGTNNYGVVSFNFADA